MFEQLGLDYELQLTLSGALNIAQLVAVVAAFFFLDKFGRKIFLIVGAIGLTASHAVVAAMIGKWPLTAISYQFLLTSPTFIGTYSDNWPAHKGPAWVGVGFIFGVMIFYGVGWGPVPWAMRMFISHFRGSFSLTNDQKLLRFTLPVVVPKVLP